MPTAPSFAQYKIIVAEPFLKNGKPYITVEHPTTKNHRDVRWYSDKEYTKLYGTKDDTAEDKGYDNLKEVRGFKCGPILVVRNNRNEDEEWLRLSPARYARGIGWHFISGEPLPNDTPPHFKFLSLSWEEFRKDDDRHMKSEDELTRILAGKARKNEWVDIKNL